VDHIDRRAVSRGRGGAALAIGLWNPPTDRPPTQLLMNNAEPVGSTVLVNKTGTGSDRKCVATPVDSVAAVTGRFVASFMALWAIGGYNGLNGGGTGNGVAGHRGTGQNDEKLRPA